MLNLGRFMAYNLPVRNIFHTFARANRITVRYVCMKSHCPKLRDLAPAPPIAKCRGFFIFILYLHIFSSLIYFSGSIRLKHIHACLVWYTSEYYPFVNTIIFCPLRTHFLYASRIKWHWWETSPTALWNESFCSIFISFFLLQWYILCVTDKTSDISLADTCAFSCVRLSIPSCLSVSFVLSLSPILPPTFVICINFVHSIVTCTPPQKFSTLRWAFLHFQIFPELSWSRSQGVLHLQVRLEERQ